VRASEETVRRWLKRYLAEGVEGLPHAPHPGAPRKVIQEYRELLVQAKSATRAAWGSRSRFGPYGGWLTTWPRENRYLRVE